MRCGLFIDLRNPEPWRRPWQELYRKTFAAVRRADEIGLDAVWLTEHHFVEDGYTPSLMVTGGVIAGMTERIRIGTWVLLLPLHDAIRLSEDAVSLDAFSAGRLDLGVGLGYRKEEFETLGIPREERVARMEEGLEVLRRLSSGRPASFAGDFYSFEDVHLGVRPAQDAFAPFVGARGRKAARRAGRLGAHLALSGPHELYDDYLEGLEETGRSPDGLRVAYRLRTFPTYDDPDRVFARLKPHIEYAFGLYGDWYGEAKDLRKDSDPDTWALAEREHWIVGPPEHCVEEIKRRIGELPVTDLIALSIEPGFPVEEAQEAVELFVEEVRPHLV
jgi:alkanesulfonate monooxygenase SsuD/methylene tetrahydromethanopterin reductase-like flavin-dependent oxidoreductase (luciferase family)